jgi:aromatic-L-amino-acid decarboxylase
MSELSDALHAAADLAADHLAQLPDRPVWQPVPDADRAWLTGSSLPAAGRPLADLLDEARRHVLAYPMGNGHPRFVGWVNSPPSPAGVAVAAPAAALNPSCAGGEHAGALLEYTVTRWLAELVGYPHSAGAGLLTSGASLATVVALATARHRAARRAGWDVRADGLAGQPPMTGYVSAEAHSCLRRATELLGLGHRWLRTVAVDGDYRLDLADLRRQLAADRAAGLTPLFVAGSAGTVSTGAVDPLAGIADLAEQYDAWFHVDGAYGAFGVLAGEPAADFSGLDRADSVVLDPHKWLGVPVDCGCVLFRDPRAARDTFSLVPAYLRDEHAGELGWFAEYGPEQTRPPRSLRAWATLASLGRSGVVDLVDRTCALARRFAALLADDPRFELLAPVATSIVAFRYRPEGSADVDAVNRAIPARVQRAGRAFLTGTRLGEVEALRACFLNPATTDADLAVLRDEVHAAARSLAG